jgi:ADP-ribosyl-[dinitrogen reductase] hydrolase
MAEILFASLSQTQTFDPDDITARYLAWWKDDAFDTGPTFAAVFKRIECGMERQQAVHEADIAQDGHTAGCNPAHRIAPLALFPFIKTADIGKLARQEAMITHYHPLAGDMAALMALTCRLVVEGYFWRDVKRISRKMEPSAWAAVDNAKTSDGGFAPDVMRTALHFLDGRDSIQRAIDFAGQANYAPVLVGVIGVVAQLWPEA